jgi:hypothetical protein
LVGEAKGSRTHLHASSVWFPLGYIAIVKTIGSLYLFRIASFKFLVFEIVNVFACSSQRSVSVTCVFLDQEM